MPFKGFAKLKTPSDLYQKLKSDYQRVLDSPKDPYCAFDYFVTAYHIIDWLHPGWDGKQQREELETSHVLIQLCSHLANGAKHFHAEARKHKYVTKVSVEGCYNLGWFDEAENRVNLGYFQEELFIQLDGEARDLYGPSIAVTNLARKLLEFWGPYFNDPQPIGP